jgi:hypothetical protein
MKCLVKTKTYRPSIDRSCSSPVPLHPWVTLFYFSSQSYRTSLNWYLKKRIFKISVKMVILIRFNTWAPKWLKKTATRHARTALKNWPHQLPKTSQAPSPWTSSSASSTTSQCSSKTTASWTCPSKRNKIHFCIPPKESVISKNRKLIK